MFAIQTDSLQIDAASSDTTMVLNAMFMLSDPTLGTTQITVSLPVGAAPADIETVMRDAMIARAAEFGRSLPAQNIVLIGLA